jgi:hypothetical protein
MDLYIWYCKGVKKQLIENFMSDSKAVFNNKNNRGRAQQTKFCVRIRLSPSWPCEFIAIKAIDKVIVAWLIVEEIVADAQKALHLLKLGKAGVALIVVIVVRIKEVRVGACLC